MTIDVLDEDLPIPVFKRFTVSAIPPKHNENYFQELTRPSLERLGAANDRVVWAKCKLYWNRYPTQYKDLLAWATKNKVHPYALVKVINRKLYRPTP